MTFTITKNGNVTKLANTVSDSLINNHTVTLRAFGEPITRLVSIVEIVKSKSELPVTQSNDLSYPLIDSKHVSCLEITLSSETS
ncbi:hypothetical protein GEMRC1_005974 [Eukaryota sp. GEM-RC1]